MQNLGKILKQLSLDQKAILDKARIGEFLQTKYFQTELTNVTRGKPTRSKKEDFFQLYGWGGVSDPGSFPEMLQIFSHNVQR